MAAPTTTIQDATNIGPYRSRLNALVANDGGAACEGRFRYRKSGAGFDEDKLIDGDVFSYQYIPATRGGPFWTSATTGYVMYLSGAGVNPLVYRKTTDGGSSWSDVIQISGAIDVIEGLDCWADWQTPGDSGTKIHIAYLEKDEGWVRYASLDTSTDTLSSLVNVSPHYGQLTFHSQAIREHFSCSITKSRGGKLFVSYRATDVDDAQIEGFYISTDGGANWTSKTVPWEDAEDYGQLYCGNETDTDDVWLAFWDRSATEISLKTYDYSENSWSEQSIASSMASHGFYLQMDGQIRKSDGHLIFTAWDAYAYTGTGNLKCWDINGAGSITAKTNLLSTVQHYFLTSVYVDQTNDDIYVAYAGGTAMLSEVAILYKKSTDGGATWGSQGTVQQDAEDDERWVSAGCAKSGTIFMPVWFNDDLDDLFCNSPVGAWVETAWANGLTTDDPFHADITGLTLNIEYEFQAQNKNEDEGDWSSSKFFTTGFTSPLPCFRRP